MNKSIVKTMLTRALLQRMVIVILGIIFFTYIMYITIDFVIDSMMGKMSDGKIEGFNVYDIMSGEASLYPGYECPFGNTSKGCNMWTGCQNWSGSLIHPDTSADMTDIASVQCQNPNLSNNLHRNWNPTWLKDSTKKYGGASCSSQTDGFKCKSGLCLNSNGSNKCANY